MPNGVHSTTLPLDLRDGGNERGKALPRVRAFVASTSYETSPLVIEERFDPGHVDSKRARLEKLFLTPLKISFRPLPEVQLPAIYPLEEGQTQRKSPYQHLKVQHIW